ncbi:MAG: hypothetical protein PVI06_13345 [Desulfobacterales bacterium]
MKTTTLQKTHRYSFFSARSALVLFVATMLVGCFANYGRLEKSSQIKQAFESYQILDGYRYYYSGRQNKPSAIIGVHRDYSFSSEYWTEIELTPEAFKKAVKRLYPLYDPPAYGAYIIDPNGKRAGVWFSSINFATIKLKDVNRLIILTPEPLEEPEAPTDDFRKMSKFH